MRKLLSKLVVAVMPSATINSVYKKMSRLSNKVEHPGLAIVINQQQKLLGIVTDGDIRRAYAKYIDFKEKITEIMIKDPILINKDIPKDKIKETIDKKILQKKISSFRHIIFINEKKQVVNIKNFNQFTTKNLLVLNKDVTIFGMGYVGLVLAVWLANENFNVVGVDINTKLIKDLKNGKTRIFEPGLKNMLNTNLEYGNIKFTKKINSESNIYIIAVNCPIKKNKQINYLFLKNVLKDICKFLKKDDLIILRSTLVVGTVRKFIIPYIEKNTQLKAGLDFNISFSPERSVEGNALEELRTIPQIVGGYTKECTNKSTEFWSNLVNSVVQVENLETAELIKLSNNTFRDLSFAFANELALTADNYNINTFKLINAANKGYYRNIISFPSPGVGGSCLSKDPFLYTYNIIKKNNSILGKISRKINDRASMYPIKIIKKYSKIKKIKFKNLKILILGIAFKGIPETNDYRESISIKIRDILLKKVKKIYAWDAVIDKKTLNNLNFITTNNISKIINQIDVVLILNNHPNNTKSYLFDPSIGGRLIFDGWHMLDSKEILKVKGLSYATMGYSKIIK